MFITQSLNVMNKLRLYFFEKYYFVCCNKSRYRSEHHKHQGFLRGHY